MTLHDLYKKYDLFFKTHIFKGLSDTVYIVCKHKTPHVWVTRILQKSCFSLSGNGAKHKPTEDEL